VPFLPALHEAVWRECRVRLNYQRGDGTTVERVVDPLGLVAKGSVWYLVAAVDGEVRTYRVSRVQDAQPTGEPCVRPTDFDLAAFWDQAQLDFRANLPRFPVIVRAAPSALEQLSRPGRNVPLRRQETEENTSGDAWMRAELTFQVEWEAVECLLGLGAQVEVLEPSTVREQITALARAVLALYAGRAPMR
jgi:predicted DNA-binding transcriptional regulator YafY